MLRHSLNTSFDADLFPPEHTVLEDERPRRTVSEHSPSAWQILPIEGTFEVVYEDRRGIWTTRILDARELKLGPGRTLLGGIDRRRGLYRGMRVDRIRRLGEPQSGLRIETGILDWLLVRTEAQRRLRRNQDRRIRRHSGSRAREPQAA